jgi:uncharacterized FlaG/YvyC family protein
MKTYRDFLKEAKIVGRIELPKEPERNKNEVSKKDLNALEKKLDDLFKSIKVDVDFGKHFFDRLNHERNKKQITISELEALFTKTYKKYKEVLSKAKIDWEAVLKDLNTDINIPFVINYDKKDNELILLSKTIMRKKDFKSPDKILPV